MDWPRESSAFLEQLPAVFETDHVLITHARLDPTRPIMDQDPYYTAGVGGDTVRIELDSSGMPLWFAGISPMLKKPLCMGHIGYSRVELVPGRLYALDTRWTPVLSDADVSVPRFSQEVP